MGASIGDLLSRNSMSRLILGDIRRGLVFRMELTREEGIIPKNDGDISRCKYFIVLDRLPQNKIIGFLLINTKINQGLSEEIKNLYYPLNVEKYPFLEKRRFVCCEDIKEITEANFIDRYDNETGFVGEIDGEDMDLIIGALKESPVITPKQLKKYNL